MAPAPWQRFEVWFEGLDEPIIAQTNALDWRSVPMDPGAPQALDVIFRVTHNALVRAQVEGVPRHYDRYCERLAGIPTQVDDGDEDDRLDPTPTAHSAPPPSR